MGRTFKKRSDESFHIKDEFQRNADSYCTDCGKELQVHEKTIGICDLCIAEEERIKKEAVLFDSDTGDPVEDEFEVFEFDGD